jgi:site-specific recombinase XerD
MTDLQVYNPLDQAVAEWLDAKAGRSNSARTLATYRDTMADFRAALAERGADLLSDPALVAMCAEQWAASSRVNRQVSAATFNLRLAVVSSFYVYYGKKAALTGRPVVNPLHLSSAARCNPTRALCRWTQRTWPASLRR